MKIGDSLFFAPKITFSHLDLNGNALPKQYHARIDGYYLLPARTLLKEDHGFAALLLILCAIDALSVIDFPKDGVKIRFVKYVRNRLSSFRDERHAALLYEAFRCGLVHEARAKEGAEISLSQQECVKESGAGININPFRLLDETANAMTAQLAGIESDVDKADALKQMTIERFRHELDGVVR